MDIEKTKADLWLRASLRNVNDRNYKDQQTKIAKGIESVAVRNIMIQADYIDKVLLPRIEKKSGVGHDYKFFREVFKSLLWAICLADRNEGMELRHSKNVLLLEFYESHAEKLERQLNKYAAMEDLFLSTGLDVVAEGVAQRARDILDSKKSMSWLERK